MLTEEPIFRRRWYWPWSLKRAEMVLPRVRAAMEHSPILARQVHRLQDSYRAFTVRNAGLPLGTLGLFELTDFSDGDFAEARITIDARQAKRNGRDAVQTFCHEAAHAFFALEHRAEIAALQRLLELRDAEMRSSTSADLTALLRAAEEALAPTEAYAERVEQAFVQEQEAAHV